MLLVHRSSFRVHRFFERVDLGEVALLVRADKEEPLVEVDGAPDGDPASGDELVVGDEVGGGPSARLRPPVAT